jgi:heptosyltransferase-2
MTTPALCRLREHLPAAHITLLTPSWLAPLWENHPAVDSILTFTPGENPLRVAGRLRPEQFDVAVILPNSPRSALETWLAGIPRRVGYGRRWRNWLLTDRVASRAEVVRMRKRSAREVRRLVSKAVPQHFDESLFPPGAHQIHDHLALAGALGADASPLPPKLVITPEETKAVETKFNLGGFIKTGQPLLGLNPGAEYGPAKRWPIERFAAVAGSVHARTGAACLVFGGQGEIPLAASLEAALRERGGTGSQKSLPLKNVCGQTTLRELMVLLTFCRALLTNDTGPMHVAAALGTSVVALFGSTAPELTGPGLPGQPMHRLLRVPAACAPCFQRVCPIDFRCMTGISIERAVEEVIQAFAGQKANTPF